MSPIGYIVALAALSTGPVVAAIIAMIMRSRQTQWTDSHIAYSLLREVLKAEGRSLPSSRKQDGKEVDRKWLLDAFAECMQAVRDPDRRLAQDKQ